ncbi:hypothetical protein QE152_g34081 [Popillia japonica]|uniref:Uncharacterized protein n=1 Tax=Popillia japonica TaxID=7064 RepID=A0AAW1IU59_POPJA
MLERLLYNRIGSHILETIPIEHARFRPNRGVGSTNPQHRHSDSDYLNWQLNTHARFRPNRGVGSTNPQHRHSDSDYLNWQLNTHLLFDSTDSQLQPVLTHIPPPYFRK